MLTTKGGGGHIVLNAAGAANAGCANDWDFVGIGTIAEAQCFATARKGPASRFGIPSAHVGSQDAAK